ncbi:MAG: lysylphosphatidylglycerol synthase transmembrane domain-containing protein [Candidatus Omnitrophota bacterium]
MKGILTNLLRICVSAGLLLLLFYLMRGQYAAIMSALTKTSLSLVMLAILIFFINIIICTFRLDVLLRGERISIPFIRLTELSFIGMFFNNFMPTALGGDIVKAYYTGRITGSKAKSYISVFMDRLTGMFSFAFLGLAALIACWDMVTDPMIKKGVLVFVLVCVFLAVAFLNVRVARLMFSIFSKIHFRRLGKRLLQVYAMLHNYRRKKAVLAKTIVISWLAQITYFSVIYILFLALGVTISYRIVFLVMPIICVVSMLPSIGGLGLREGSIVLLFGPITGTQHAFGASILLFALLFLMSIIGGIIYNVSPQFRKCHIKGGGLYGK